MRIKRIIAVLAAGVLFAGMPVIPAFAESSSEIRSEINEYENELSDSQDKSAELTEQIGDLQKEVGTLTSDLESLNIEMKEYREGMSLRIKYFYEDQPASSLMDVVLGAESFSDLISRLEYLQTIYDYDADQMNQYSGLIQESNEKKAELNDNIEEISTLLKEQETLQNDLESSISDKQGELAEAEAAEAAAREAQERAEAEAAEKAAQEEQEAKELEEAAKASVNETSDQSSESSKETSKSSSKKESSDSSKGSSSASSKSSSSGSSKSSSSSSGNVAKISMYPNDSGGVLTRSKGVVYYNGHKETWYSQRVLPGGGLNIPGRHVDENGLIRDGDGYICVASSDLPKGTLIETSLGMGKVYDSGCASGTIDIYTDW